MAKQLISPKTRRMFVQTNRRSRNSSKQRNSASSGRPIEQSETTTVPTRSSQLRVSFDESKNSYHRSDLELSDSQDELWYTSKQLKDIKTEALRLARRISEREERRRDRCFYRVVDEAFRKCRPDTKLGATKRHIDLAEIKSILDNEMLGLERHIVPSIEDGATRCRNRQFGTIYILPVTSVNQRKPHALALELRNACEQESRQCREFAVLMAVALAEADL